MYLDFIVYIIIKTQNNHIGIVFSDDYIKLTYIIISSMGKMNITCYPVLHFQTYLYNLYYFYL